MLGEYWDEADLDQLTDQVAGALELLSRAQQVDELTGLIRPSWYPRLHRQYVEAAIDRGRSVGLEQVCLVMLDVDDLKTINTVYGFQTGSRLIRHVGSLLRQFVRGMHEAERRHWDAVHQGGDEFLLLGLVHDADDAVRIVESFQRDLNARPLRLSDGGSFPVRATAGVTVCAANRSSDEMLAEADLACKHGKELRDRLPPGDSLRGRVVHLHCGECHVEGGESYRRIGHARCEHPLSDGQACGVKTVVTVPTRVVDLLPVSLRGDIQADNHTIRQALRCVASALHQPPARPGPQASSRPAPERPRRDRRPPRRPGRG